MTTHPSLEFVHADIRATEVVDRVLAERQVDTIVHFAAESHVDRSISNPGLFLETNVMGTHVLLRAARAAWSADGAYRPGVRFHHVSTDEVYGSSGPDAAPATEETPYAPNSPYAASKAASDHLVRAYHHTYGLPVTTSNCSNNYGPYQFPEKLIPLLLINALTGKPLPIYGDGMNVRDWLYVGDHCRAIESVLLHGCPGEVYNIGGGGENANIELVRRLCAIAEKPLPRTRTLPGASPPAAAHGAACFSLVRFVRDRLGHDRRYAIDATNLSAGSANNDDGTMRGLRKTFQWYRP